MHFITYAGLALFLCAIVYYAVSHNHKGFLVQRTRRQDRRLSFPATPPRSLSPEEKAVQSASAGSEYADVFPPSQRHVLAELSPFIPAEQQHALGDLRFDSRDLKRSLLSWEEDYRLADPRKYCCSGFSIREIKALGNFPDYASLSGVPLPQVYENFDIDRALPRPFRPFRWGYHQTMSLTKLETDWWIELENTYRGRIVERQRLYSRYKDIVLQWLPGSELACKELMEMVLQFVCARYPTYFELLDGNTVIHNKILATKQLLSSKHPLLILLDNIPEDFALMLRNPETGYYHFRAGIICSALGWNTGTKIGKKLHEIHAPVPDYKEKMQFSMDRFFTKMPTSKPIQRGSWGLEVDQPLFMPPGDPHEKLRDVQSPEVTLERIHNRVDWQTLRRLPLSGAIVFNFKAVFTPISEFRDEPYVPSLLLKVMRDAKENLLKYKNTWHIEHVALPAFVRFEREQKDKGLIEEHWEPKTLDESPFFPGWEEKWHAQQGF